MKTNVRTIVWCAVSTRVQAEDDRASLPQQEADARAVCERNDWTIVDVLRVPGHSRHYRSLDELAEVAAKANPPILAFRQLLDHFRARDFDLLICRDGNRFARTQSLHSYIVETVIEDLGARIYALAGGMIDSSNYLEFMAMNGYMSAKEIQQLKRYYQIGMNGRMKQGLPTGASTPWSHIRKRDERGRDTGLVPDESKRRFFNDAARLILEGVPWLQLEQELYTRFGHANENHEPYRPNMVYQMLLLSPAFWGHTARGHRKVQRSKTIVPWIWEPGHALPEGVSINYNTHEPVYTGELARQVQAEIIRRNVVNRGRAAKQHQMFARLLVCVHCGYSLARSTTTRKDGTKTYMYYCQSKKHPTPSRQWCPGCKSIKQDTLRAWFDQQLRIMLDDKNAFSLLRSTTASAVSEAEQIAQEITAAETQLLALIRNQAKADESVSGLYQSEIDAFGKKLKVLRERLSAAQRSESVPSGERYTLNELKHITMERFWQLPPIEINRWLMRLMRNRRLVIDEGKIVGIK